jgi:hypothetical protein
MRSQFYPGRLPFQFHPGEVRPFARIAVLNHGLEVAPIARVLWNLLQKSFG